MSKKICVTQSEYLELQRLADIVNNSLLPIGQRRIARAEYGAILQLAKNRPNNPPTMSS